MSPPRFDVILDILFGRTQCYNFSKINKLITNELIIIIIDTHRSTVSPLNDLS